MIVPDATTCLAILGVVAAVLGLGVALAAYHEIGELRDYVAWLQRELTGCTNPDDPDDGERTSLPLAENDDEAAAILVQTELGTFRLRARR